jgi:threonine aldolase
LGSQSFIKQARRFRKVMGGGWRQAGFLAAAGIYALDHHIDRLRIDHARAKEIGDMLLSQSYVEEIFPISTNIVIIRLPDTLLATDFVHTMAQRDLFCVPFGKHLVRFVTHLDFHDKQLEAMPSKLSL